MRWSPKLGCYCLYVVSQYALSSNLCLDWSIEFVGQASGNIQYASCVKNNENGCRIRKGCLVSLSMHVYPLNLDRHKQHNHKSLARGGHSRIRLVDSHALDNGARALMHPERGRKQKGLSLQQQGHPQGR